MAIQTLLLVGIVLSAGVGLDWPSELEPLAYAVGILLLAVGSVLLVAGAGRLGSSLTPFPAPRGRQELSTAGLYRHARHPMYGGVMLVALGWAILFASLAGLALTVVLALFLGLKARREELWLVERYPEYGDYRRSVPRRFIPFVY